MNNALANWNEINKNIDLSNELILSGIKMRLEAKGKSDLSEDQAQIAISFLDNILNSDSRLRTRFLVKTWGRENISIIPHESEVISMDNKRNTDLLLKLKIANDKFLRSNLAQDMRDNSNPESSFDEILRDMSKLDKPLSVIIYEGREHE